MVKICLDAGHGGKDPGAVGNGLQEKDLTLDITLRIAQLLKDYDCEVVLTRSTDVFVELDERAAISNRNKCDCFLCVHINSGGTATSARGYQDHIYPAADSKTTSYQNVIHEEVYNYAYRGFTNDRGKEKNNFAVLRETNCIAILTENLFVTNPTEAKFLADPNNRQKIAQGHVNGLVKFYGLKKKNGAQPPPPSTGTKLWKVQVGAFSNRENADKQAATLKSEGYRPFVIHDDNLYKVQVGAFEDKKNAEALSNDLARIGYKPFLNYE